MTHYKFDKKDGLVDETGKQILQLLASNCSAKFRVTAGKLLAEKLNTIERRPLKPLAMDHAETVVDVRPARVMATKGDAA